MFQTLVSKPNVRNVQMQVFVPFFMLILNLSINYHQHINSLSYNIWPDTVPSRFGYNLA